jgi:hypothetical protein
MRAKILIYDSISSVNLPPNIFGPISKINVRSAVNATLWLCGLISIPSFYIITHSTFLWIQIVFTVIGLLPIAFFVFVYTYFMFNKPEYLRSETFQIKKHFIDTLGDKDHILDANAELLASVANPLLLSGNEHDK